MSEHDVVARALDEVISDEGMVAVRASSGRDALSRGLHAVVDAMIIDEGLAESGGGIELASAAQATTPLGRALPVLLVADAPLERSRVLAAMDAGVWDVVAFPFDGALFAARLRTYIAAKRRGDAALAEALIDRPTGTYSPAGLARRAEEIAALAERLRTPIGCVALAADLEGSDTVADAEPGDAVLFADLLRQGQRRTDVLARTSTSEFALLAPSADSDGTRALVERIRARVDGLPRGAGRSWRLRAAWTSIVSEGVADAPLNALRHAGEALTGLRGRDVRVRELA